MSGWVKWEIETVNEFCEGIEVFVYIAVPHEIGFLSHYNLVVIILLTGIIMI
jgi:hypothetical protein